MHINIFRKILFYKIYFKIGGVADLISKFNNTLKYIWSKDNNLKIG